MPLLTTLGSAGVQSYGTAGIQPGGSFYFVGGSQYLTFSGTALTYGTGNFTIEFWWKPIVNLTGIKVLYAQWFGSNNYLWIYQRSGQIVFATVGGAIKCFAATLSLNTWYHIALVRNSGSARIFVNGVGYASATVGNNYATNTTYNPCVGQWFPGDSTYPALGYLTNLRISKSAIYTADFTPSRTPFTRTSQGATAALLLNVKSSSTFTTDSSANAIAVTNNFVTYDTQTPYTDYYVTPAGVTVVSATVTPSTLTGSEGSAITFTIAGTNTTNGTYYYTIEQASGSTAITTSDFTSASLSGSFTITSNSGSFNITPAKDLFTEGTETFSVAVRQTSITGPIIGSSDEITITDVSLTPAFTVTPANINEGSAGTFTVANLGPDGTYYWTILNGTSVNADFSAVSGSFTVSGSTGGIENGTGSFTVTPIKDLTTEGGQTFQVEVRSGSTSGTILVTSSSVTIIDTSVTPFVTPAAGSVNEGATLSVTAGNLGPDGTYYWSINHVTTAAADFTAENGSFSVTGGTPSLDGGSGSFNITTVNDYSTEGAQTFTVSIRSGSVSGTVLVTSSSITVNDTSTTVTASGSPTAFNEGASTTITASATAFPAGTYFWTVLNGTTTNADFTAVSGSFSVASNTGSFTVTAATLGGAEAAETFQVQIRTVSTSGTVIATTGTLTINANAT